MSKRRRTNSIASSKDGESLDGNGNGENSGQSVRKRRKKQDPMELVQQVYDSIRQQRKEDGTLLCDAFIRIPKRRQAPLYYELVRRPLDLLRVQQKLKTDEYSDIDDLQADIELIVSNAKQFHRKTSQEYRDAQDLLTLFYRNKAKIIDGVPQARSTASSPPLVRGGRSSTVVGRRSLSSLLQQRGKRAGGGRSRGGGGGSSSSNVVRPRRSLPSLRNHANHYRQLNNSRRQRERAVHSDDDDAESGGDQQVRTQAAKHRQSTRRIQRRQMDDSGGDEDTTTTTTTTSRSSTTAGEDSNSIQTVNVATAASHTNAFEELFTAIMTATDLDGEALHTEFQLLPSRRKYPKYYHFIDTPIDLRMIARKIQSNSYHSLADMERDVNTLARNACVFNEPGSHIYRSAKMLRRVTQQKRLEMDQNGCWKQGGRGQRLVIESKSERIRNRRLRGNAMSLSAITAALKDDSEDGDDDDDDDDGEGEEEEEDGGEGEDEDDEDQASASESNHSSNSSAASSVATLDSDNPKWQLFDAVRGVRSPGGAVLSEPFWRLPSRRFYPDYYREIKNPVSLTQIRRKLTSHLYGTVSEVAGDLTVVFENAKRYNDDNSKLYKDAVKLQKVMQLKLQELLDIDQVTVTVYANRNRSNTNKHHHNHCKDFDTDLEPEYKRRGPKPKLLPNAGSGAGQHSVSPRGRPPKDASRLTDHNRLLQHVDNNQTAAKAADNYGVLLKKRLHTVAKFLLDYKKADGRQPLLAFVEKPSKKLYPDYYEVIREPIDFLDIEARIKAGRYASEREMVRDFRLMFSNCRTYNETNSPLYEDACLLEKVLLERIASNASASAATHPQGNSVLANANSVNQQTLNVSRVGKGRRALSPNARRCKSLYDTIREYREPKASRQLSTIFLKLPSKSDYPDYYEVIPHPIDLERIGHKAKQGKYHEVDDIAADLVLMFDNACKFNEPDSQVYKDALVLHQLTLQHKRKLKQAGVDAQGGGDGVPDVQAHLQDMLLDLFTSVYNHQDEEERCYSDSLAELPEHDPPSDEPGVAKGRGRRGLSLDLIKRRLDGSLYQRLDTFQADVFECLERARRLSRTDSQVFEDAVELQRFFVRRRDVICRDGQVFRSPALRYTLQRLNEDVDEVIRGKRITEEAADVEEELLSATEDSAADKSTLSLTNGPTVEEQGGDGIKYDRDESKKDNSSSQVQSANAQRAIRVGDFVYLESGSASTVAITSSSSLKRHNHGLNNNHNNSSSSSSSDNCRDKDREKEPHIALIERIFNGSGGCQMIYGSKYLRPAETYHVSTRRFLEREVFKSDTHVTAPLSEVAGRCCVLSVKVYFTQRPADFRDDDVYVLESRYSTRMRNFKKIKIFRDLNHLTNIKLVNRETPIEPKRVMSVFRERLEKHKDELQELQECLESDWIVPNVPLVRDEELEMDSDGLSRLLSVRSGRMAALDDHRNTYYEQYACQGIVLKTGDFVYVMTDGGRQLIAQISAMWTNKDGKEFFRGPWFVTPSEVPPSPTRLFYRQEVFLSTVEDTNPLLSIVGKCSVLHYNEFISSRVTDVLEADVYICTSLLDEVNRQVKRLPPGDGLRKVKHRSTLVLEDEIYFFPRILNPPKKVNKTKIVTGYILYSRDVRKTVCVSNPDSNFGEISKIVGNDWRALPQGIKQTWEERALRMNDEAKERDRQLQLNSEDGSGNSPAAVLPPPDQVFECLWDKCDFQFEELSDCVEHCIRDRETGGGHVQSFYAQRGQDSDLNCMWRGCGRNNKKNVQPFPNMARLTRHVRDMHINKGNGRSIVPDARSKNFKPSSKVSSAGAVLGQLGHLQQQGNSGGSISSLSSTQQQQLHAPTSANSTTSHLACASGIATAGGAVGKLQQQQQVQYDPMFISVPPRPQRALHSEAYIKYIEGLHAENKFISPWERTLSVTQQSVQQEVQQQAGGGAESTVAASVAASAPAEQNKLQHVVAWLGPQYHQQPYQQNHQEHVVNALWALRNQLLKDALGLQKTL